MRTGPFAPVPRRLLIVAAGAVGTAAFLYLRNKVLAERDGRRRERHKDDAPSPNGGSGSASTAAEGEAQSGSVRELSLFLAGESWYDEIGWQGIWEREGIESPEGWLRTTGKDVLVDERKKLEAHPALLAGCRRRWIVVCRYAGVDVGDAAALWNSTEA